MNGEGKGSSRVNVQIHPANKKKSDLAPGEVDDHYDELWTASYALIVRINEMKGMKQAVIALWS